MSSSTLLDSTKLVFDTTCLCHFARADRLDVLGALLVGQECLTTDVVRAEIRKGVALYPDIVSVLDLEWMQVVTLNTIEQISRFVLWTKRVGAGERNLGEASVLAVAEELSAVALIDERDATSVGRAGGVAVHGTIWLLAEACRTGKLTEVGASNLIDALAVTGMRLPCTGAGFPNFARVNGLL